MFKYNDEGIRTSKTTNGVTTTYYLSGSQILAEETNGNLTIYVYNSERIPVGMQYHGASYAEGVFDVFWYEKNLYAYCDNNPVMRRDDGGEFWREKQKAMEKGWTQKQFNDYMNNPDFYRIEDPHLNRSHKFEMPK